MQTAAKSGLHPIIWVAAIAVTAFSLVGIGALTGMFSPPENKAPEAPIATTSAPAAALPTPPLAPETAAPVASGNAAGKAEAIQPAPAKSAPAQAAAPRQPSKAPTPSREVASTPAPVPSSAPTTRVTHATGEAAPPLEARPAAPICRNCGVVESVSPVQAKSEGSGLGAIAGGVVGGLLGNQVGKGTGKDLATIAGAVAGGVAGHQIEKNVRSVTHYEVGVRMDDGSLRTFSYNEAPTWRAGDRVQEQDGTLQPAPSSLGAASPNGGAWSGAARF